MMSQARCPSPVDLERGFWTKDVAVRAHARACEQCAPQWSEIEALASLAAEVETPVASAERREEMRTRLLAGMSQAAVPGRRSRLRWVVPALAAAGAAVAVWWVSRSEPRVATEIHRARILDHGSASYLLASAQPDEIVRVVDGTLTFEVAPLSHGERFRVVAGDAEVEVVGTAFDITVADDRLVAVRVMHGIVEVRVAGEPARRLGAGEQWRREITAALAPSPGAPPALFPAGSPELLPAAPPTPPPATSAAPSSVAPSALDAPQSDPRSQPPSPSIVSSTAPSASAPAAPTARSAGQQAFDDGWAALRAGENEKAASAFERAVAADGGERLLQDATYWQAVALARAGRNDRAIRVFERFLDAAPDSARAGEASVMLGWLLFQSGDAPGAEPRFRAGERDVSARVRKSAREGLDALQK